MKLQQIPSLPKGQLISKCLFEKIVWTKIPAKNLIDSAQQDVLFKMPLANCSLQLFGVNICPWNPQRMEVEYRYQATVIFIIS